MSTTESDEFSTLVSFGSPTCREALYQFPNTKIAILDEDGTIIAANIPWTEAISNHRSNAENPFQLGANYLDIWRTTCSPEQSRALVEGIKSVTLGAKATFTLSTNDVPASDASEGPTRIFACPVSDSSNAILVAHHSEPALNTIQPQHYQNVPHPEPIGNREFT